jgi:membrane protein CcdC involved in cytochrome C biogenesis
VAWRRTFPFLIFGVFFYRSDDFALLQVKLADMISFMQDILSYRIQSKQLAAGVVVVVMSGFGFWMLMLMLTVWRFVVYGSYHSSHSSPSL